MLVSDREKFLWRDGSLGDLIPLIGDGLLTTDGEFHDRAREIMMPAFHRERTPPRRVMFEEAERALDGWRPGERDRPLRLDAPTSRCGSRCGRCSASTGPRRAWTSPPPSSRALLLRARVLPPGHARPREPVRAAAPRPERARPDRARRDRAPPRATGGRATTSSASSSRRPTRTARPHRRAGPRPGADAAVRRPRHDDLDRGVHLLRARPPARVGRAAAAEQRPGGAAGASPPAAELFGEMPELSTAVDETLRLYPPAWIGPRRAGRGLRVRRLRCPPGCPSTTRSWASHHLPDVFGDPHAFRPERFRPRAGRGSEGRLHAVRRRPEDLHRHALRRARGPRDTAAILGRFRLDLEPGWELRVRQIRRSPRAAACR